MRNTVPFFILVSYIVCACALVACGAGNTSGNAATTPPVLETFSGKIMDDQSWPLAVGAPLGVAADSTGNVYVADHNYIISKITPTGIVTTLDNVRSRLVDSAPSNYDLIASDRAGNVYMANTQGNSLIKISATGQVGVLFGGSYDSPTGTLKPDIRFHSNGITTDSIGNVYMITTDNTILKLTPAGVLTTLNCTDEPSTGARCNLLRGLAIDSAGNFYAVNFGKNTIHKISPTGLVTTLAGSAGISGNTDGTGSAARFNLPKSVAADNDGNIYVADAGNNTIRKISAIGVVTTLAGSAGINGNVDGVGAVARFSNPSTVTTDAASNIYVADTGNTVIRKITATGLVTTFTGSGVDGVGSSARFGATRGMTTDTMGNVYVADWFNQSIRKITPFGVVTTLAGATGLPGNADGTGTAATFNHPSNVATDSDGNIYVADVSNQAIRKITPAGVVTTLAKTDIFTFDDITYQTRAPGITSDHAGNIYVTAPSHRTIYKITPAGLMTIFAGTFDMSGSSDGVGQNANFCLPSGLATDSADNIYVADGCNATIRKITPKGVVTTVAGTAGKAASTDGTGTEAYFMYPSTLAIDNANNIYVGDSVDHTVRKMTPKGVVSTVIGMSGVVNLGAGNPAGSLNLITGIAIHGTSLYIATSDGVAVMHNAP